MKILSIDTASNICTVAILENTTCLKELIVNDARNHSEKIMPLIEQVLAETHLTLSQIDLIVCNKGPGSFTGIRIGVGTVLAFRDSLNIKCLGISSLEALAYNVNTNGLVCSLIDAKNNNIYFGLFDKKDNNYSQIGNLEFKTIDEAISLLKSFNKNLTFVGDGSVSYRSILSDSFPNCTFCDNNNLSSVSLGIAGYNSFNENKQADIMPLYLRKSQAERALEEKGGNN